MTMKVGIPQESFEGERRVAATPSTVAKMRKLGLEVLVQSGAGLAADYDDAAYLEAGAEIAPTAAAVWSAADIVLKVRVPTTAEAALLKEGGALIGFVWPGQNKPLVELLAGRKATVLAMDAVPRITRAQKMDALSAMANLVGYRAVVEAASALGRIFGGQMTAAGRSAPASVLIVGAGVAGLAAIAAAKGLGATVKAFDTRPAVREQVESLGARFLEFEFKESGEGEGGYAKEMSEAYLAAEQALIATHAKSADVVITTALIPGRPAPVLLTSGAVVAMAHGSVIVDLAAEQGGNCPLTERDKIVEKYGKKIIGYTDLPSRLARQASDLYATTVYNLLEDVWDEKAGKLELDLEDEVHRGAVVLQEGKLLWPPPSRPPTRTEAPRPAPKPVAAPSASHGGHGAAQPPSKSAPWVMGIVGLLLLTGGYFAGSDFVQHLTVFLLACVVGWHVVWNVAPALHTPLMSVTNAISGIILVGGVLLMRAGGFGAVTLLAAVAILIATINVAGGFLVTQRMLRMFRR
jgi:NAD(P) transhydrogenase subunit alpha